MKQGARTQRLVACFCCGKTFSVPRQLTGAMRCPTCAAPNRVAPVPADPPKR